MVGEGLGLTVVVVTSLLRSGSDSLFRGDGVVVVVIYLAPPLMSSSSLSTTTTITAFGAMLGAVVSLVPFEGGDWGFSFFPAGRREMNPLPNSETAPRWNRLTFTSKDNN